MLFWALPQVATLRLASFYAAYFDFTAPRAVTRRSYARHLGNLLPTEREALWRYLIMQYVNALTTFTMHDAAHVRALFRIGKLIISDRDAHDLARLEERAFASTRPLKTLSIAAPLQQGEAVYVKYDRAFLKRILPDQALRVHVGGTLLFTNQRLLIVNGTAVVAAYAWKVMRIELAPVVTIHLPSATYQLTIHDDVTLRETMKNLLARKVRLDH